jgi:hypothetical protein
MIDGVDPVPRLRFESRGSRLGKTLPARQRIAISMTMEKTPITWQESAFRRGLLDSAWLGLAWFSNGPRPHVDRGNFQNHRNPAAVRPLSLPS